MKVYVLILLFWDSGHGANSLTHVEFSSRATCEAALEAAHRVMDSGAWGYAKAYGVCVER